MITKQIVLASRPKGMPTPDNFRFETVELPPLRAGEVLLKGIYYSVDPYLRGRMNDGKSYVSPFQIDEPLEGGAIAKVLDSKSGDFHAGDLVVGTIPWQEQCIVPGKSLQKIDTNVAPATYYLGILGMTGLTAYFGLMHIGKPRPGETVVISGAGGAVGTVVGQLAKLQGCRVIGITGTDEKVAILTSEFGFDAAINYKTTADLQMAVAEACPDGVDIYFDNVGGEISDAVISLLNFHARIPLCGQISLYNSTEKPVGPRIQPILLTRSALMQGFIISNFQNLYPEGIRQMGQWVKAGKLKSSETIVRGFDQLPNALIGLFEGTNTGKMMVAV